jgi:Tfp pilus assembly protein PilN
MIAASRRADERAALNLARRAFVNDRPVLRISVVLWLLGALLLLGNLSLFQRYLEGSKTKRAELESKSVEIDREKAAAAKVEEKIQTLDIAQQNQQVAYVNRKIRERTFSWSDLFDRISEVLPQEVRLERLAPRGVTSEREPQKQELLEADDKNRSITLSITGESKNDEALRLLQDRLYEDPSFDYPNVSREAKEEDGLIRFDLAVGYRPQAVGSPVLVEPGVPPARLEEAPAPVTLAPPTAAPGGRR